jgi:hypothetical protein
MIVMIFEACNNVLQPVFDHYDTKNHFNRTFLSIEREIIFPRIVFSITLDRPNFRAKF